MWSRFLLILALTLGISPLLAAPAAHACACKNWDETQHADYADAIFEATLPAGGREVGKGSSARYEFAVTRVLKGRAEPKQTVFSRPSSCSLDLEGTGPFLVFANRNDKQTLTTDLCSGTRLVSAAPASFAAGTPSPLPGVSDPPTVVAADPGHVVNQDGNRVLGRVLGAGLLLAAAMLGFLVWPALQRRRR